MNRKLLSFLLAAALVIAVILMAASYLYPLFIKTAAPITIPKTAREIADCQVAYNNNILQALPPTSSPQAYSDARAIAIGKGSRARAQFISANKLPSNSNQWTYEQKAAVEFVNYDVMRTAFISALQTLNKDLLPQYEQSLQAKYDMYTKCIAPTQVSSSQSSDTSTVVPGGETTIP